MAPTAAAVTIAMMKFMRRDHVTSTGPISTTLDAYGTKIERKSAVQKRRARFCSRTDRASVTNTCAMCGASSVRRIKSHSVAMPNSQAAGSTMRMAT